MERKHEVDLSMLIIVSEGNITLKIGISRFKGKATTFFCYVNFLKL